MRRQDSNLRPPGYEAVSSTNRSHFGSVLCFLSPFARRIFRCFHPALPAPILFRVKTGSEAVERISGAANHAKKICLKSPKMKKHLHRTFACGASFCRAENGRKRGRGRSDDISCRKKYISCRRPHKSRKICYTEKMNLKNCPGAPPDP